MLFCITEADKYHAITVACTICLSFDVFGCLCRGDDIVCDSVDRCTVLIDFVQQALKEIYQDTGFEVRVLVSLEIALREQVAVSCDEIH